MAKMSFKIDSSKLKKNIDSFSKNLNNQVAAAMQYESAYAAGWLKQNAPWHDDTGAARTGLVAIPFSSGNNHEIFMAYSVYYGIWLEVANSGRYAVITPGMRIIGEKIMNDMETLLKAAMDGK